MAAIIGAVLGVGLLAGTTLLLQPGPGALASAGFLIALPLGSLAAAFWVGGPESGSGLGPMLQAGAGGGVGARLDPGPIRTGRRWFAAVVIFLVASPFAEAWVRQAFLREAAWGRSLAVLLLLALPAYGLGSVLAALMRRRRDTALAALAGGSIGALAAAVFLIPKFDPGILFASSALVLIAASWVEGGGRGGTKELRGKGVMQRKVVVVTGVGAPGQMGYALAEAFVAQGANVVLTARNAEIEELAQTLSTEAAAIGVAADLAVAEEAERVIATALREFGRVDVLANVAGGLKVMKPLGETTPEEWAGELDRNARTAFLMSRAALPALRESRGTIINFAAPAGLRARAGIGAYSAAKAAVVALTRALALEEKQHGVRVNAIAPGMIDTEQNRAAFSESTKVAWVSRKQIVDVTLFLASEQSSGISGETIEVLG